MSEVWLWMRPTTGFIGLPRPTTKLRGLGLMDLAEKM